MIVNPQQPEEQKNEQQKAVNADVQAQNQLCQQRYRWWQGVQQIRQWQASRWQKWYQQRQNSQSQQPQMGASMMGQGAMPQRPMGMQQGPISQRPMMPQGPMGGAGIGLIGPGGQPLMRPVMPQKEGGGMGLKIFVLSLLIGMGAGGYFMFDSVGITDEVVKEIDMVEKIVAKEESKKEKKMEPKKEKEVEEEVKEEVLEEKIEEEVDEEASDQEIESEKIAMADIDEVEEEIEEEIPVSRGVTRGEGTAASNSNDVGEENASAVQEKPVSRPRAVSVYKPPSAPKPTPAPPPPPRPTPPKPKPKPIIAAEPETSDHVEEAKQVAFDLNDGSDELESVILSDDGGDDDTEMVEESVESGTEEEVAEEVVEEEEEIILEELLVEEDPVEENVILDAEGEQEVPDSSVTENITKPGIPGSLTLTYDSVDRSVLFSWDEPEDTGGRALTDYWVYFRGKKVDDVSGEITSFNFSLDDHGMVGGRKYFFGLRAYNGAEESDLVKEQWEVPDSEEYSVPDSVDDLLAEKEDDGDFKISWDKSSDDFPLIKGYKMEYKVGAKRYDLNDGDLMTTDDDDDDGLASIFNIFDRLFASVLSIDSEGLYNYTADADEMTGYDATKDITFYVTAVSERDVEGLETTYTIEAEEITLPGEPKTFTVSLNDNGKIDFDWLAPTDVGSGVTGYKLYSQVGDGEILPLNYGDVISATEFSLRTSGSGLEVGETYNMYVSALNSAGEGEKEVVEWTYPDMTLTAPVNLGFSYDNDDQQLEMTWEKDDSGGGNGISEYKIYLNDEHVGQVSKLTYSYEFDIEDDSLVGGEENTFGVTAVSISDETDQLSDTWTLPEKATGLSVTKDESDLFTVEWDIMASADPEIDAFKLEYSIDDGTTMVDLNDGDLADPDDDIIAYIWRTMLASVIDSGDDDTMAYITTADELDYDEAETYVFYVTSVDEDGNESRAEEVTYTP